MIELLKMYGLFFAKTVTVVIAVVFIINTIVMAVRKGKRVESGKLEIKNMNRHFKSLRESLHAELMTPAERKQKHKSEKKEKKAEKKADKKRVKEEQPKEEEKHKLFVLDFKGDVWATAQSMLREEITAILPVAGENDEVVVLLESGGGVVHEYGLAASQLLRLKEKKINLTILVDKIAASGGYMMACVANKLVAAPFAIIGSVGVLAQMPNFNKLLKKHDIEYEQITAGEYKRTLTMFGENTKEAREKFTEQLEDVHGMFKDFIKQNRPEIDIDKIATGEYWYANKAKELGLVDELKTSDDYLLEASETTDIYRVIYKGKESVRERIMHGLESMIVRVWHQIAHHGSENQVV